METLTVKISCDSLPLEAALASLTDLANGSDEVVNRFLSGLDSQAQLVRVDGDVVTGSSANEVRVILQPSDLLCNFLATHAAPNIKDVPWSSFSDAANADAIRRAVRSGWSSTRLPVVSKYKMGRAKVRSALRLAASRAGVLALILIILIWIERLWR